MNQDDFPILKTLENDAPLIYFDNAATTQKPKKVLDAVSNFYQKNNGSVGRGIYDLSYRAEKIQADARAVVANFLGIKNPQEIIFNSSATECLNLVAYSLSKTFLKSGDEVLLSYAEHHSNLLPWKSAAKDQNLKLVFADYDTTSLLEKINEKTRIVSLSLVSNVLGTTIDAKKIIKKAHLVGAIVILDAAQAIAHLEVNAADLDTDFLVFSGHKIYAENGVGVLYGKSKYLEKMPPLLVGGGMIDKSFPEKFEAGSRNVGAISSLSAALEYFSKSRDKIFEHEKELTEKAYKILSNLPFIEIYGEKSSETERFGIISFNVRGAHPHDIASILDSFGITVRAGHHCAKPLMERLKILGCLRVSFGMYNTLEEVEKLGFALEKAYKEIRQEILKNNQNSKYRREIKNADFKKHAINGSCGDDLTIFLKINEKTHKIEDASFLGDGCVVSISSADKFCEFARGKTLEELKTVNLEEVLGSPEILKNPIRVKCATLAWNVL